MVLGSTWDVLLQLVVEGPQVVLRSPWDFPLQLVVKGLSLTTGCKGSSSGSRKSLRLSLQLVVEVPRVVLGSPWPVL